MKLTQRDRRALLLLGFSAVLLLFLNYVAVPWGEKVLTSDDDLRMAEKKLRHEKAMVVSAPVLDAEVKTLQARLAGEEQKLLSSNDPSQASAQLQQWISQRAADQKIQLLQSDFIQPVPFADSYLRVPIRVEVIGQITQVAQFMNALTHGDRLIAVDDLSVNSGFDDKDKKVRCSMVISALMRKTS